MTDVYIENRLVRQLGSFELEMAKRDVCFFYEEQLQWEASISGQLSFGQIFNLPYWDYLDLRGEISQGDRHFVRRGSLLLLLSECLEFFDDLGTYYLIDNEKLMSLKNSVRGFSSTDKTEAEVRDLILVMVERIEAKDQTWEKSWEEVLNKLFVTEIYGYFRSKFKAFDHYLEKLYISYSL